MHDDVSLFLSCMFPPSEVLGTFPYAIGARLIRDWGTTVTRLGMYSYAIGDLLSEGTKERAESPLLVILHSLFSVFY